MSVGPFQLLLIVLVILIVFGAGKLPKVMGDLGKGIRSFKKGLNEEESKALKNEEDNTKN
jgi:sec-independent protein translocase protein TatA